ncbi:uncharacterized protein METZ01_LOCUS443100, partial [marine metagenome]
TPTAGEAATIDVGASKFTDAAGNGNTAASQFSWRYAPPNTAPVANAGSAQTVDEGTLVTLNGSGSDDDNDPLTYAWTGPQGVTLSDASSASLTFTAPQVDGVSAGSLPNITGLVGHYTAASFNDTDNEWNDLSGSDNHAAEVRGDITSGAAQSPSNGASKVFDYVEGTPSDGIQFPTAILPSTYTLFHVARYSGDTKKRIFDGINNNWLSGFWNNYTGVGYHGGTGLNADSDSHHEDNWVISSDQTALYRSNGAVRDSLG